MGSGDRNVSNTHLFARIGEKKFFHEFYAHDVYEVGIKRFWAQKAEMSLTPISWLESARRYFSWTWRTWCLKSRNETFLGSGGRNEPNTHEFARIGLKKFSHEFDVHDVYKVGIKRFWAQEAEMGKAANSSVVSARKRFSWTLRISCLESRNQTFLGSGDRNASNTHLFARIGEKKFFHEFYAHDVYEVGIKCFWAQEAEMSLTPISWLESARRYFSWTRRTWCLKSRNETFLGSGGRTESNTHQFARIGKKKFFYEFHVHDVCKVGIKRFWAQEAEMSPTRISWLESARRYFSWTRRTWCLESRNETFLGSDGRNESNTHQFARIGENIFFINSTDMMSKK